MERVGIDVAKAQVDVAIRPSDDRWEISRDDAGVRQLVSQLKTLEPVMVLLEASGGLELPLVAALATCLVVNPRQVRDFARATAGQDRLARGGSGAEVIRPPVRPLRDAETQVLQLGRPQAPCDHVGLGENRLGTAIVAVRPPTLRGWSGSWTT